ncbi:hypothetical protein Tco_0847740 [Tanacetum coccineum]
MKISNKVKELGIIAKTVNAITTSHALVAARPTVSLVISQIDTLSSTTRARLEFLVSARKRFTLFGNGFTIKDSFLAALPLSRMEVFARIVMVMAMVMITMNSTLVIFDIVMMKSKSKVYIED